MISPKPGRHRSRQRRPLFRNRDAAADDGGADPVVVLRRTRPWRMSVLRCHIHLDRTLRRLDTSAASSRPRRTRGARTHRPVTPHAPVTVSCARPSARAISCWRRWGPGTRPRSPRGRNVRRPSRTSSPAARGLAGAQSNSPSTTWRRGSRGDRRRDLAELRCTEALLSCGTGPGSKLAAPRCSLGARARTSRR